MPETHAEQHNLYLKNFVTNGTPKVIGIGREVMGQHKDGSTILTELSVGELNLGNRRVFTSIVRDISPRKAV